MAQPADERRGSDAAGCKTAASRIVAETGASFERVSPSGDDVVLTHPYAKTFTLSCARGQRMSVFVSWPSPFPPSLYFTLVAAAGAIVTRESGPTLRAAAKRCQLLALKNSDETDQVDLPHAELDCQAFLRDGGSTAITVATSHDDPSVP